MRDSGIAHKIRAFNTQKAEQHSLIGTFVWDDAGNAVASEELTWRCSLTHPPAGLSVPAVPTLDTAPGMVVFPAFASPATGV